MWDNQIGTIAYWTVLVNKEGTLFPRPVFTHYINNKYVVESVYDLASIQNMMVYLVSGNTRPPAEEGWDVRDQIIIARDHHDASDAVSFFTKLKEDKQNAV